MTTITTIHGDMDDSLLVKTEGTTDTPTETTYWVEYRLPNNDEIVHRSVNMTLKEPLFSQAVGGEM